MIPFLPHISLCYDWCDEQTDDWTGGLRKNMNILLNAQKKNGQKTAAHTRNNCTRHLLFNPKQLNSCLNRNVFNTTKLFSAAAVKEN